MQKTELPNDVIGYINDNQDIVVDWVFEFFSGKYSREQVKDYLYTIEIDGMPRKGVAKLSNEFRQLETKTTETIRNWYTDTDLYVFDLLPWNGCNMFKEKADTIIDLIKQNNYKSVTDFGGGLGILSTYIVKNTDCKVVYVDLKDSVTFNFAKYFINKYDVKNIEIFGDEEYFGSNIVTDCIISTDCFEHIPNMEETFNKLIRHSNAIYHDSTFNSDYWSPQHVYTPTQLEFLNMCAKYNFLPNRDNIKILHRVMLQFDETLNLQILKY